MNLQIIAVFNFINTNEMRMIFIYKLIQIPPTFHFNFVKQNMQFYTYVFKNI